MKDVTKIQKKTLKLLKKGKLEKASEFFCSELMKIDHQYSKEAILIQAQLSYLRKDKKAKLITEETYIICRNKLMKLLINLIKEIDESKVKIITQY